MTTVDRSVPIPECLAHLPVQSGLAVPVVALQRGDRWLISVNHVGRAWACIEQGRCGICGRHLDRAVVLTARPDLNHATDPANHPECVAYAARACPMLSGRMSHYLDRGLADHPDGPCDRLGCECGGSSIVHGPKHTGEPAPDQWWAVWVSRYKSALNPDGTPYGLSWNPEDVIRSRPVR